ncbi:MBL fold metallo-hydrolase [Streptomyces sp. NPDC051130]|uniref:MBL fold metallo-hydrolase n=1 Tax=Streptomyces sp. NPDC051130 TaxID=3157223 RepID=UPI00341D72F9
MSSEATMSSEDIVSDEKIVSDESKQSIMLGDVEVTRVVEWQGPVAQACDIVPGAGPEVWRDNAGSLAPDHWDPQDGRVVMAVQTWVLRSAGRTVLVDTGVGDMRERPGTPMFHHWRGDLLGRLALAGIRPEDVDVVVNTHVHGDHVGGNTTGAQGEWAPAFPNARYLIPAADDFHYGPRNAYAQGGRADDRLMYADSIEPVHRAGQAVLWEGVHRIDEHLVLEAAPGHTPGSSVLRLDSGGDRAVFVGDLVHSPVQILSPRHNSCFCLDPSLAAATRRRILEGAADRRELVVPAHFGGPGALEVRRQGGDFTLGSWAAFGQGVPTVR